MKIRNEIQYEICRRSYIDYVEYVHEGRWLRSKHLEFVCYKVQEFIETKTDNALDILLIKMPPQHGKSQSITETLPSWYLGKYQEHRIIEVSYSDNFAWKFGRRNREKISKFGKQIFDIELSKEKDSNAEFELSNKVGGMISRGILSGITGNPANLIIIDDPIKTREEADSETIRDKQWDEWLNSIRTRCSAGAKVIIIMTPWHEDDIAGRILKNEKNVTEIRIPCEAEENDILGRNIGDALFPEIGKDNKWLEDYKSVYKTKEGSRSWNALFQCRPSAEDGDMFKRAWLKKFWDKLPNSMFKCISVDATFKDKKDNDNVSITVWGKSRYDYYLIDRDKRKMDFPTTLEAVRRMKKKHPDTNATYIEDKANGSAIISVLRNEMSGVVPIEPEGGKIARANAVTPLFEAGNVYLPDKSWINDYIDELVAFPNGAHDDDVDSTSQALNKLRLMNNLDGLTEKEQITQFKNRKVINAIAGQRPSSSFFKS